MNTSLLLLALFLIVFEAVYEGLKSRGKHIFSEMIEFVYRGVIVIGLFAFALGYQFPFYVVPVSLIKMVAAYILMRFGIFDVIWNISAGKEWNYIGLTKLYDRTLQKIPGSVLYPVKFICLVVGIVWFLNVGQ
jgi:uncharacterized membrane protein